MPRKPVFTILIYTVFIKACKVFQPCRHILHTGVQNCKGCHGLHHNHGARDDNRVMAAFDLYIDIFHIPVYRFLWLEDGRGGLYVGSYDDRRAVADAAENPSGMVGFFG